METTVRSAPIHERRPGEVLVRDGLLSAPERAGLAALLSQPIWQYGWRSDPHRDRFPFWHVGFAGGGHASRRDCEAELARHAVLRPIHRLWQRLEQTVLKGHVPVRVYANAHTYGIEGYVHVDSSDREDYFSTVYYAHSRWNKNWAGETVFYGPRADDIIASVYPRPGRVVSFHGAVPHCARAPSRECNALRLTVVVKTRLARR